MAKGIISSREQRKQFDAAVKDVIRQRKAVNQLNQAAQNERKRQAAQNNGRKTLSASVGGQNQTATMVQQQQQPRPSSGDRLTQLKDSQQQQGGGSFRNKPQQQRSRRSTNLLASSMTASTKCNGSGSEDRLQHFRQEHPRRISGSGGSFPEEGRRRASTTLQGQAPQDPSSSSQAVPGFATGNRRSSDGDAARDRDPDSRRSSWNKANSFRSSLNKQLVDLITDPPKEGGELKHRIPRVTSAGQLADLIMDPPKEDEQKYHMPRVTSAGNMTRRSSFDGALLVPTYRPRPKHFATSNTTVDKGGNGDWELNRKGTQIRRINSSGELAGQIIAPPLLAPNPKDPPSPRKPSGGGDCSDDFHYNRTSQRGVFVEARSSRLSSSGSVAVDRDIANGLDGIKEGTTNSQEWVETALSDQRSGGTDISTALLEYKLEDLVPTRRTTLSRENSERIVQELEAGEGEGKETTKETKEGGSSVIPHKDRIAQWKKRELRLEPAQVDFNLGQSERMVREDVKRDAEIDAWFDAEGVGESRGVGDNALGMGEVFHSPLSSGKGSVPSKNYEAMFARMETNQMGDRVPSSDTLSFVTANSREPSPRSPNLPPTKASLAPPPPIDEEVCLRSQFGLLKSKEKSQSGATGRTQGTSSSSLYSSDGSFNPAAENPLSSSINNSSRNSPTEKQRIGNIDPIKEEVKDIGDSVTTRNERRELASGDSFQADADNAPGFSTYKNHRISRIKKIRKGIKKTLLGSVGGGNSSGSVSSSRQGSHEATNYNEVVSHGGSTISAEQKERLSRHLQRKDSSRSMSSVYSTLSAITGKSDATSSSKNSSSKGPWRNRFRLKGKTRSMHNINANRLGDNSGGGSSSRQILVTHQRSVSSNMSGLSNRSERSFGSSDGSAFTGRFIDFYDHGDHAKAVSSLISSKSTSGRSLVTSLATVKEPAHHESLSGGGEQKHDEDYHHSLRSSMEKGLSAYHTYMNESVRSEDTVNSFYRHPSHEHCLVHMRPNQLFPNSPGWQCDECGGETFDLNIWAYVSTEKNYLLCESCFTKKGFSVAG